MRVHNKLVIKTKDKTYSSFNNLFFPFAESLRDGGSYSKFLAYGVGREQTDPMRLGEFSGVVELVTESHNFDPTNGTLFIRKKWVLDENDKNAYEFVEVGLTPYPNEENPKIANRFLVNGGEPIYRDAGEEMTFEITIYLEFAGESNLKLTAGSNALVKFLLGEGKTGEFYVARGYDRTSNEILIERSSVGVEKVLSVPEIIVEDDPPRMTFDFRGELSPGEILEFLLIIGDEVVARQNVKDVYGGSNEIKVEITADDDCYITLPTSNISEITGVNNITTGEAVLDYKVKPYGTSFAAGLEEIFSGLGYKDADKVIISKQQDKIAFIKNNVLKIYTLDDNGPTELDASNIDVTDGYLYLMFEEMFLVKCAHPDGTYSVRYYHRDVNGVYVRCNYYLNNTTYETVCANEYWINIDAYKTKNSSGADMFVLVLTTQKYVYAYRTKTNRSFDLLNDGSFFVGGYLTDYASAMEDSNRLQNCIVTYDGNRDRMGYRKDGVFRTTYDVDAVNIAKNYRAYDYPKAAKNYSFAVDNVDKTIKLFSIDTLQYFTIPFVGAEKIMVDDRLDYAVVKYPSGVYKAFYIDASRNLYEFMSQVPIENTEILKMFVIGDYFVFFLNDGRIVRLKINKNKMALCSVPIGNVAEVSFRADVTPGQDGKPIGYFATMNITADANAGGEI